jgi:flagellar motor switch/type III secretory pathway protein FliN
MNRYKTRRNNKWKRKTNSPLNSKRVKTRMAREINKAIMTMMDSKITITKGITRTIMTTSKIMKMTKKKMMKISK